jgi:hypothetical protein
LNLGYGNGSYLKAFSRMKYLRINVIFFAIFILLLQGIFVLPASGAVSGTVDAHPRLVRKGETFQVTLTILSDKELRFQNIDFPEIEGLTFIPNFVSDGQSIANSGSRQQFTYTKTRMYSADEVGKYDVGPFRINYDTEDELGKEILIDPVSIEVYQDAPRPSSDIILGIRTAFWKYLIIPGLIAILAGLVWALIATKRRKKPVPVEVAATSVFKTPEQIAIDKIKALVLPNADDIDKVREYYDAVDDILREYLATRFEVNVKEATSYEIRLEFVRRQRIDARAGGVMTLINDCDWVKFAKSCPSQQDISQVPMRASRVLFGK